ncbi:hypothetical protein AVEN_58229-1 [Araneus ventricosus]|uniref:Uncharacterized protein n=1 Tax=Araneus ventricosus TaxID=182803 RepID=A0A4Y2JRT7_ARAVE|nr:hypothetical protein AVEN_58229-1 [Araneus ventricosus]
MPVEASVPSVNQFIETNIDDIRVKVAESLNNGFLKFGIGPEMATYQVLLQLSEEIKITSCQIGLYEGCSNTFYQKRCTKKRVVRTLCGQALSSNNRARFESSPCSLLRIALCDQSSLAQ